MLAKYGISAWLISAQHNQKGSDKIFFIESQKQRNNI